MFQQIWQMSGVAAYCILAVLLLRWLCRRAPRKYLYLLWLIVAFRLVCPVSVSTQVSLFNIRLPAGETQESEKGALGEHLNSSRIEDKTLEKTEEEPDSPMQSGQPTQKIQNLPSQEITFSKESEKSWFWKVGNVVWMTGVIVFLLYFIGSMWCWKRKVRMAIRTEEDVWECDNLSSPFVMGIVAPRIYLPCGLGKEARELILLHERYHIRRCDHLVKLFAYGLLAVYWFHPLVWAAWYGMCQDMEMSCDEKVLEQLNAKERKQYGRTLLDFASKENVVSVLPPAFGEQDVKKRIQHVLVFQKPVMWVGILAAVALVCAVLALGTDAVTHKEAKTELSALYSETAQTLYEARNLYIGDASANGKLLGAIAEVLPDSFVAKTAYKTQLQTSAEPYEFWFLIEEEPIEPLNIRSVYAASTLMLALTENLGVVQWFCGPSENGWVLDTAVLDVEEAERLCGVTDLKAYGKSPKKVQELLDILGHLKEEEAKALEEPEDFMNWYTSLPVEIYEQAALYDPQTQYEGYQGEPCMVRLAESADQAVTVYGCYSKEYGARGITIEDRITPDGDRHPTNLDLTWYWGSESPMEVAVGDYDQDGEKEIALSRLTMMGRGSRIEELTIFERNNVGIFGGSIFSRDSYARKIEALVGTAIDPENRQVHVILNKPTTSSVPLLSVPYEEGEEIEAAYLNVDYHFELGEELYLETAVGLKRKGFPGIWYGYEEEQKERRVRFRVGYQEDDHTFTLADPQKL